MAEKTRNSGKWTEARFRSFVTGALRRAAWPVKYAVIETVFVKVGTNPATGRKVKLYRCESCKGLFMKPEMEADHTEPVVDPAVGFTDWNEWIKRYFVELDCYKALCKGCHKQKTAEERKIANNRRSLDKPTTQKKGRKK